jgi:hypothetical protein
MPKFKSSITSSFLAIFLALFLALVLDGCAMPKQANDVVLTALPDDWKDQVLIALAPRATDDLVTYDSSRVNFTDDPRPCVFQPTDGDQKSGQIKGHCGSLVINPAGRTKLPPANYMYIVRDTGGVDFIRQD